MEEPPRRINDVDQRYERLIKFLLALKVRQALARSLHEDLLWGSESPGNAEDSSEKLPWDELPRAVKRSVRRRAREVLRMLQGIGLTIVPSEEGGEPLQMAPGQLELLSEEEHERWMRMRRAGGWRRGPVKSNYAKTHPSIIPYAELSEAEREKDRERVVRLPQILASAGLGVRRD